MIDLYNTTLFGIKTFQSWHDLYLWEAFLSRHNVNTIIELGTYVGGMSIFLLLQAVRREIEFWTFDNVQYPGLDNPAAHLVGLKGHFIQEDVLREPLKLMVLLDSKENHPLMLYCDNGDKPLEFKKYMPLLQSGDYISVHDWGAEIAADTIKPYRHLIERILWEECKELRSRTRFWKVK